MAAYLDLTLHGVRICSPVPEGGRRPLRLPREPDRISHRCRCLISLLCAWRPAQHLTFVKARQAAHAEQTRGNKVWRGKRFGVGQRTHTHTKVSTFPGFYLDLCYFAAECVSVSVGIHVWVTCLHLRDVYVQFIFGFVSFFTFREAAC